MRVTWGKFILFTIGIWAMKGGERGESWAGKICSVSCQELIRNPKLYWRRNMTKKWKWRENIKFSHQGILYCEGWGREDVLLAQARQCRPTMSNFRDLSSLTLPPPTPRARHCAPRHKLSLVYIISLKIIESYMSSKSKVLIIALKCCIMNIVFWQVPKFVSDGFCAPPQIQSFWQSHNIAAISQFG